jgi:hypothetical protein
MGWAGHVAHEWDGSEFHTGLGENLTERYHLEDLDLDEKIKLKCEILSSRCSDYEDRNGKQDGRMWSGLIWRRIKTNAGLLKTR